jgi:hypothetical protein
MTVFWVIAPYSLVEFTDVSEVLAASRAIALMTRFCLVLTVNTNCFPEH